MKKLCLITTARSDFGILRPLIKRLNASRSIDIQVVVTGQHALSQADRSSLAEIEHARVSTHAIIDPEISGSRQVDISDAVATICSKFGKYLERERPKAVIVLGDRYELMGLVSAAVIFNIPIIHLHGGELSLGAIDNQIRNAVTQFADLHFTATKAAAKRVSVMTGSESIYFTGSLSVEELKSLKVMDRLELFEYLKIDKCLPSAIITFHPETTTPLSTLKNLDTLLSLVAIEMSGFNIVVTMPNADHLNIEFCEKIKDYAERQAKWSLHESLGRDVYLSCLRWFDIVIGNSSSGIIEAPSMKIPSINVGGRQAGREKALSVFDFDLYTQNFATILQCALSARDRWNRDDEWPINPYSRHNTVELMVKYVEEFLETGCRDFG